MSQFPRKLAHGDLGIHWDVVLSECNAELRRLRQAAYAELAALVGEPATREVAGEDGKTYQIETEAVWDSKKVQEVRVIVTVDDGGWSAFKPITSSFIMRADELERFCEVVDSTGGKRP